MDDRRQRQREMEMNLYHLQKTAAGKDVKSMLTNHEKQWRDKEVLVKTDVKSQEEKIRQRIEERKNRIKKGASPKGVEGDAKGKNNGGEGEPGKENIPDTENNTGASSPQRYSRSRQTDSEE